MVTFQSPQQLGTTTWLIPWTSDQGSPTYRVFLDGVQVSTQLEASYILKLDTNVPVPIIEVLDTSTAVPSPAFPSYLIFGWNLDLNAAQYLIEQWTGSAYVTIGTINADTTKAWQVYATGILADETTAQWRITPIDAYGNNGTPVVFTDLMVRNPDVPAPTFTYNGAGPKTVTLS